ncbi:glyoxalase [Chryseobacterium lactis]|uniref:Glyoxalase n=1 Tax=Chryseobacterium lactis TaxID=1241981 RepID=A0A3G6REV8_CHRLC|nr:VOC family protein [Chryseobacterium lactis]AZA82266.1 glyoxalase [Chryseobacterium lactis]AZB02648.1 glyoxalase [Chryseobacterium lactis]PNW14060.1 glyoxalase [Chryseobacterium lactis]
MKIEHIAIWVKDLEKSRMFYQKYFGATSNEKYHNPVKNFQSYFLSFDNGCRIEIMTRPDIETRTSSFESQQFGIVHLAFSAGSKEKVDGLTEKLRNDGYTIAGEPRTTGDGYYESVILDPENNIIEIVA